jgi:hypothetical protein
MAKDSGTNGSILLVGQCQEGARIDGSHKEEGSKRGPIQHGRKQTIHTHDESGKKMVFSGCTDGCYSKIK